MKKKLLITGGAGFIGSNLAERFLKLGYDVTVFDNFVRRGTRSNFKWLKENYPGIKVVEGDIRNENDVLRAANGQSVIFHLAAQVAVTTSVTDPRSDFEINALGTFNILEAARSQRTPPILIFSSTNKVYGGMDEEPIIETKSRYMYKNLKFGVSEKMNLDFHSPYGCSKGAADQYVRDYCRIYGIPSVVFRQSCIYGPRQFGVEDQGWVAWFIIALTQGREITVYGDGKQVRDILYIDDLVEMFLTAVNRIDRAKGKIYNIGGGMKNTLSVWNEFSPILEKLFRRNIKVKFSEWRPGDQKVYISDIRYVARDLGWKPKIGVENGIEKLFNWIQTNRSLFKV